MKPSFAKHTCSNVIIIESWRLWEAILENLGSELQFERISDWSLDSDFYYLASGPNRPSSLIVAISQGSSMIVDALERARGSGATKVIRLGTCGGLGKSQSVGHIVLASAGIRDEGTSRFYLPESVPALASPRLLQALSDLLITKVSKKLDIGIVWSTDGRWRESDELVTKFAELGAKSVDMETAALLAAGMSLHVDVASISLVADLPIHHLGAKYKGINEMERDWSRVCDEASKIFQMLLEKIDEI